MGAFKAYDIRGIYNKDFNKDTVYKIGFFVSDLLKTDKVAVGRDVRVSSPEIFEYLVKGITDSGSDVLDLGLCTTPMVYFATKFLNMDASIQITASHNPAIYNGLKISRTDALPVGGETGLKELEEMVNNKEVVIAKEKGKVLDYTSIREDYISFLKESCPDLDGLNISIDFSNGMANIVYKDIIGKGNFHYLYDTLDGSFPNHEPNPLEVENCHDLMKAVIENKSDVGIIFDGDADRVMFIDELGQFIQPDYVTALIAYYYKKKGITANSLVDIRTSRSTTEYLEKNGFPVTIWKVGHAFAKLKIREINGLFGGELAGHYYFKDFFNCDSGIFASLLVLSVVADLKRENKTLSEFFSEIIVYANSGEKNFKLEEKDSAINALYKRFVEEDNPIRVLDFDGFRIEFDTWWFNVRKSNTEPYLRIVAEAKTKEELDNRLDEITSIIKSFS